MITPANLATLISNRFIIKNYIVVAPYNPNGWYKICNLTPINNAIIDIEVVYNASSNYTGSVILSLSYADFEDKNAEIKILSKAYASNSRKLLIDSVGIDNDNFLCIHKRTDIANDIRIYLSTIKEVTDVQQTSTTQPTRGVISID